MYVVFLILDTFEMLFYSCLSLCCWSCDDHSVHICLSGYLLAGKRTNSCASFNKVLMDCLWDITTLVVQILTYKYFSDGAGNVLSWATQELPRHPWFCGADTSFSHATYKLQTFLVVFTHQGFLWPEFVPCVGNHWQYRCQCHSAGNGYQGLSSWPLRQSFHSKSLSFSPASL